MKDYLVQGMLTLDVSIKEKGESESEVLGRVNNLIHELSVLGVDIGINTIEGNRELKSHHFSIVWDEATEIKKKEKKVIKSIA